MKIPLLDEIDAVVASGKAVMQANDRDIVDVVKQVMMSDRSASFYLSRKQADAIRQWYWTPERIALTGMKTISTEEHERIRRELGINVTNFRYAPIDCECGHLYGAFDFLQQGIREHGLEMVAAIFSMKNSTFFQINPSFVPVCPACGRRLPRLAEAGGGSYDCDEYGGCSCCLRPVFRESAGQPEPASR